MTANEVVARVRAAGADLFLENGRLKLRNGGAVAGEQWFLDAMASFRGDVADFLSAEKADAELADAELASRYRNAVSGCRDQSVWLDLASRYGAVHCLPSVPLIGVYSELNWINTRRLLLHLSGPLGGRRPQSAIATARALYSQSLVPGCLAWKDWTETWPLGD